MILKLTAETTQTTQLNLTPQLKQSIFILQIASDELADFIQTKATDNPFLDIEWPFTGIKGSNKSRTAGIDHKDRWLNNLSRPDETAETALLAQLRLANIPKSTLAIAQYLAGNLNESGYLEISIVEASAACCAEEEEVLYALACLQSLEPAGIAARDLKECLLLQIERDSNPDPWAAELIGNHMQELAGNNRKQLADKLNISVDRLLSAITYIRTLNPKPGLAFGSQPQSYIQPDAKVQKVDGEYAITMTDAFLPKVMMNKEYCSFFTGNLSGDVSAYVRNQRQDAEQLLWGLAQRKVTLRRVIEIIVKEQKAFLDKGVSGLKPMNLKAIAAQLGLHESTISRAVQNKYMLTPQGVYALKYFFPSGVSTVSGEEASAESIRTQIKLLVEREDKKRPLSDQQMTDLLNKEGIQISRRTVMKYREELRILSSRLRSS
ncbi:RNA polymerase sigma-54 factor [Paenibacillus allorhizoplanae]|uniref:RNA polymerase sigma-54 factor n=1 Tax=Paenibacillus allorhizoplanae TaxID=2905648 RepID=A0ABN8H5X5_9BACL|nr:RNA polymerase factor sigma-54 [Paenibacillus allorhizoplanae]CAH1231100.1 RNA polymerase sigma-54 factor [Paenibacillus allorhizoplanae]